MGDSCYQSLSNQLMGMTLLSTSDVIFGGQSSAFTQSMPLTIALAIPDASKRKLLCEVGIYGDVMQCVDDYFEWLGIHYYEKSLPIPLIGNTTSEKQGLISWQLMPMFKKRSED